MNKILAQNRAANHNYFIEDRYEAGIELFGTEVKSIRAGNLNLKDSYCRITKDELYAENVHISPYEKGNIFNRDPLRPKRLLMHKKRNPQTSSGGNSGRLYNRSFIRISQKGSGKDGDRALQR